MAQKVIALPFKFNELGEIGYTYDYKKIVQDRVIGVIMTLKAERVMSPSFGTSARKAIFETESAAESLVVAEVRAGFGQWLSDLILDNVLVEIQEDDVMEVLVQYTTPTGFSDEVSLKYGLFTRSGEVVLEGFNGRN